MAKGDGGIKQILKDGKPVKDSEGRFVWELRVSTGWNPIKKKYGIATERFHGNKTAARQRRDELRRQLENGIDLEAAKTNLGEFADKWLSNRIESGELAENTIDRYSDIVEQIKSYLGTVSVSDVTPLLVDDFYRTIKIDRCLTNTSVRKIHQVLRQIMKQACIYDMILRNPCDRVKAPQNDPVNRESLSAADASKLLAAIDKAESEAYAAESAKECRQDERGNFERGYIYGMSAIACVLAARLGLATGARRGEILAVTWQAIGLDSGLVSIAASITAKGNVKDTKTKAGNRVIALDAATVNALRKWQVVQTRELGKIGFKVKAGTPVFSDGKGGYINPCNFSRWWRKFTAESGFEGLKLHELRHTQATLLLSQGVDIKTVQNRLGHSNASITLNWYAHAVPENDRAAADTLGKLLDEPPKARIVEWRKTA